MIQNKSGSICLIYLLYVVKRLHTKNKNDHQGKSQPDI